MGFSKILVLFTAYFLWKMHALFTAFFFYVALAQSWSKFLKHSSLKLCGEIAYVFCSAVASDSYSHHQINFVIFLLCFIFFTWHVPLQFRMSMLWKLMILSRIRSFFFDIVNHMGWRTWSQWDSSRRPPKPRDNLSIWYPNP